MDESELIHRAVTQDAKAWEDLVLEHQQSVFRLAYLFTGDPDEAEDIAQEAFIRAFRSIGRVDPGRPFRPWVLSIAANLARNRRRGLARYLAALGRFAREIPNETERTWPIPSSAPSPHEDAQLLWETVRRMSRDDQQVIYLRYFLELSEEEAGAVLRVPTGTVKSRLHRALKRLRDQFAQEGNPVPQDGKP